MAISFPTSLDNFTNPSSGNTLDSPSHSLQHSDINDAVEAMQRKVGVGTAVAGSASAGQVLTISAAGTSTWSTPSSGLVQIVPTSVAVGSGSGSVDANGRITFTGASSISINDVFSSTYENYRILLKVTSGSTNIGVRLRWRVSGSDASGASDYRNVVSGNASSGSSQNSTALLSYVDVGGANSTDGCITDFVVRNPNVAEKTFSISMGTYAYSITYYNILTSGVHLLSTAYTGFTLLTDTGTMTGTVSVYGYK